MRAPQQRVIATITPQMIQGQQQQGVSGRNLYTKITTTRSTETKNTKGKDQEVNLVKRSEYTVNIRSFHPQPKFEWTGFWFNGDKRSFSLSESYFDPKGRDPKPGETISRVWQRFSVDTVNDRTLSSKPNNISHKCESNPSENVTPLGYAVSAGGPERYVDLALKPKGTVSGQVITPHGGQVAFGVNTHYVGKNFAFTGSALDQKTLGITVVPGLDVRMRLNVKVECMNKYMDVAVIVYGDGFPNCEAFIQDKKGNKLFLGTHIRVGQASTQLWGDGQNLFFGHAFRIELNLDGSFGSRMWSFTHFKGGSEYAKVVAAGKGAARTPSDDYDKLGLAGNGTLQSPLRIYSRRSFTATWDKLFNVFNARPSDKSLTRQKWNDFHLNRSPNEGR